MHWPVLQGIAWAGMVAVYSTEEGSVLEGLRQTFSGERPCSLCKRIEAARAEEKTTQETLSPLDIREKYVPPRRVGLPVQISRKFAYPSLPTKILEARHDEPPTPIPLVGMV